MTNWTCALDTVVQPNNYFFVLSSTSWFVRTMFLATHYIAFIDMGHGTCQLANSSTCIGVWLLLISYTNVTHFYIHLFHSLRRASPVTSPIWTRSAISVTILYVLEKEIFTLALVPYIQKCFQYVALNKQLWMRSKCQPMYIYNQVESWTCSIIFFFA